MPSVPRRGRSIIYVEVAPALKERVEKLADARGNTFADEVREALTRHTDYPPAAVPSVPLPDAPRARTRKRAAKET